MLQTTIINALLARRIRLVTRSVGNSLRESGVIILFPPFPSGQRFFLKSNVRARYDLCSQGRSHQLVESRVDHSILLVTTGAVAFSQRPAMNLRETLTLSIRKRETTAISVRWAINPVLSSNLGATPVECLH